MLIVGYSDILKKYLYIVAKLTSGSIIDEAELIRRLRSEPHVTFFLFFLDCFYCLPTHAILTSESELLLKKQLRKKRKKVITPKIKKFFSNIFSIYVIKILIKKH